MEKSADTVSEDDLWVAESIQDVRRIEKVLERRRRDEYALEPAA